MALIGIEELKRGMILIEDIYDVDGLLLVGTGTELLDIHIDFLKKKKVEFLQVQDEVAVELEEVIESTEAMLPFDRGVVELQNQYTHTIQSFKQIYNDFKLGRIPVAQEIEDIIEPLYEAILNDESFAHKMWQIQSNDEYTFDHSVRVSMISGLLAKWCKLSPDKVKQASIAGFLHDVGKCNIPDEILNKPSQLTEEEFKVMKTHAILGYLLVKDMKNLSPDTQLAVMQHHERMNGSGYPHGLRGPEINYLAKIVAVADVYCAMTQERVYKKAYHPFEAMSYILEKCSDTLDFSISRTFLSKVSHFYIGNSVVLSTGDQGVIVMTYKDDPARPMVRIDETYIDLRREMNIQITHVLDN